MDTQQLLQQLQAAVGGDPAAIGAATKSLQSAAGAPGTSASLVQIGLEPQVDLGVRQMALLVSLSSTHLVLEGNQQALCQPPTCAISSPRSLAQRQRARFNR